MHSTDDERAELREHLGEHYPVEFPPDLFEVWDLAREIDEDAPQCAFEAALGVTLVGPFDLLAGRFEDDPPTLSLLLHYRYYFDPAELFTVATCDDGCHWGYWFDDGREARWVVVSSEGAVRPHGRTLVEALRARVESLWEGDGSPALEELRTRLMLLGTAERRETGARYCDRYVDALDKERAQEIVSQSATGMGIVAPASTYEPISRTGADLGTAIASPVSRAALIRVAERALDDRKFAKALSIATALWRAGTPENPELERASYPLLTAAYDGLGRPNLADVVHVHGEHRHSAPLDLLEPASSMSHLIIAEAARSGATIWSFEGTLDDTNASCPSARERLASISASRCRIVADLSVLDSIDEAGLRFLVQIQTRARSFGGDVKLAAIGGQPREALEFMRLSTTFDVCSSTDVAMTRFSSD